MAKSMYCYTVYDRIRKKDVIINGTMKEVRKLTGLNASRVGKYAESHWVHNGRYLISKARIDGKPIGKGAVKEKTEIYVPPELAAEWDRVCLLLNPKAREIK